MMYGRKKTASRRLPAYNIPGRQSEVTLCT
jgi:hypothetical protein